jgi:hypothetical protein
MKVPKKAKPTQRENFTDHDARLLDEIRRELDKLVDGLISVGPGGIKLLFEQAVSTVVLRRTK